jgi:crotonobetainyl-CoA:carnitine CoA-transferase CaiB-like acyl-CoA transferase
MAKALDGVVVVEFSSNMAAAYAAMLLAEQGARVVKVEPPRGEAARGTPHFHALNRSKRSTFFDIATPAGKADAAKLIARADIVIAGWTPARARQLGLDRESIAAINSRAIALELPPFGNRGPYADFEAGEELVAALGAISGTQWARSGNPVPLTFPAATYAAAVMGATGAAAALLARGDGPGQAVEISMLAGAFALQTGGIMRHEKMTSLYHGPQDPLGPIPCYRLFEASDGRYLFIACGNPTFWNKFTLAIERPDLVADPRFEGAPWGVLKENWQTLKEILEAIILTRPRDEWLALLREADVPCAPVMTRNEFMSHPQTRALEMRCELDDPTLGTTIQPGVPINLLATPGAITGPAPGVSNDGIVEALDWLDSSAEPARLRYVNLAQSGALRPRADLSTVRSARGPLTGVLVLDFCSYIAGSYGPMILAQMGADVIKIESLEGDAFRHFGFGFLGWNEGKRGLSLDFTTPEGREIIRGLARRADIIVENLRPGRMRRYGFGYEALAAINPRLIYMSVTAFGNRGPDHDQPGFDPLLQSRSGVMAAQGGPHGHPVYLTCAICDYGAAMLSAYGCVLALNARERTGRGQMCETSLLQAAMAFQAGEFIFYPGRPDMENGHAEYRGASALCRAYECHDGRWLFIAAKSAGHWDALRTHTAIAAPSAFDDAAQEPSEGQLAAALSEHLRRFDRDSAILALRDAGVPAIAVNRFGDLFDDPQILANDLLLDLQHSTWGKVSQTGILTKFAATPGKVDCTGPLLGEHTTEILADILAYPADRIADLAERRIVRMP